MLKVKEAKEELKQKTFSDIQEETAYKWASRAAASYELVLESESKTDQIASWSMAEEYEHEALEHAAVAHGDDSPELLAKIRSELRSYKKKAWKHVKGS